jgi:putative PIN family toxin of toxin-antitoxin system
MRSRRVVFDTSTLVSAALRPDSIPYRALLTAILSCDLCASEATLDELREVLGRDRFRRYLEDEVRQEFLRTIERNVRLCAVREGAELSVDPRCRDPKDNKFLALALESEAEVIVSSDEDLLALHPWNDVRIVLAAEFLREFEQGS